MQFGASYTWSKWLNTVDYDDNTVSPFIPAKQWNYGLSGMDRRHNLRVNFLYDLPSVPMKDLALAVGVERLAGFRYRLFHQRCAGERRLFDHQ